MSTKTVTPKTRAPRFSVEQSGHTLDYRLYEGREYVGKLVGVGEKFAKQIARALNARKDRSHVR